MTPSNGFAELKFRDPARARALSGRLAHVLEEIGRVPVSIMHVCGSHEQAIARFGLRATLPRELNVIMGPGCPGLHHRRARGRRGRGAGPTGRPHRHLRRHVESARHRALAR